MNKKIRVIVCGTTFGKFYIEAIRQNPEIFELVAIFAKGSERSKQCATEYKVPLITEIENIPHDIDLACVVLRSGALGGNGSMLAKSILKMKISVLQEQPIHKNDMAECIRLARKNNVYFLTCDLYVHLPAVKIFINSALKLLKQQKALYVEATCSTQVSYPLIDILAHIFSTMKPWSLEWINRENGPFHVVMGKIQNVPITYQINNEIDPDDPDNYMHLLHKITIGTDGGHLVLSDTHGPVLWYPRLYVPVSMYNDRGLMSNYPVHLNENTYDYIGNDEHGSFISTLKNKWTNAITQNLLEAIEVIQGRKNPLVIFQKELLVSTMWHDLTQKVGFANLIKGNTHKTIYAIDLMEENYLKNNSYKLMLDPPIIEKCVKEVTKDVDATIIDKYLKEMKKAVCYSMINILQRNMIYLWDIDIDETMSRLQILPKYRSLLERWIELLKSEKYITIQQPDTYIPKQVIDHTTCKNQWSVVEEIWSNNLGSPLVMEYLLNNVNHLKELLQGKIQATHLLFPEGKMLYAEALYRNTIITRYMNSLFVELVRRIAYNLKISGHSEELNIIEVGAGTGATTEEILNMFAIKENIRISQYVFSDISNFFIAKAKEKFRWCKQIQYRILDIDKDPKEQGFINETADILIAAGVLNNACDSEKTMDYLISLVKPGGYMLVSEPIVEAPEILVSQAFMVAKPNDIRNKSNTTFLTNDQWINLIRKNDLVQEVMELPEKGNVMDKFGQKLYIISKKET